MQKNDTNFLNGGELKPSGYTIRFLLNFSKSIKIIELKRTGKILMHCN
jgi:hypothetical protein